MDEVPVTSGATVSLPQANKVTSLEGFTIDDSEDVVSKPMIEQMFNEELCFGSLPKITVPRNPGYSPNLRRPAQVNMFTIGTDSKIAAAAVDGQSALEFQIGDVHEKRKDGYYVHMPHLKIVRRLARYKIDGRKPSALIQQDRRPSGRFDKTRGGKESGPASLVTNGIPSAAPTKPAGFQRREMPAPAPPAATNSPVAEAGKKSSAWPKPQRGGHGRRPPPAIKSA